MCVFVLCFVFVCVAFLFVVCLLFLVFVLFLFFIFVLCLCVFCVSCFVFAYLYFVFCFRVIKTNLRYTKKGNDELSSVYKKQFARPRPLLSVRLSGKEPFSRTRQPVELFPCYGTQPPMHASPLLPHLSTLTVSRDNMGETWEKKEGTGAPKEQKDNKENEITTHRSSLRNLHSQDNTYHPYHPKRREDEREEKRREAVTRNPHSTCHPRNLSVPR